MKVGDAVTWTRRRRAGNTITLTSMEGKIVSIDGDVATVKPNRGKAVAVRLSGLRPASETPQLTEMVVGKRDAEAK